MDLLFVIFCLALALIALVLHVRDRRRARKPKPPSAEDRLEWFEAKRNQGHY